LQTIEIQENEVRDFDSIRNSLTLDFNIPISKIYDTSSKYVTIFKSGAFRIGGPDDYLENTVLLSGSFNPLHFGHLSMIEYAEDYLSQQKKEYHYSFEISVFNVDKPPMDENTVLERMGQFAGRYPITASKAPRFFDKVKFCKNCVFLVGYDTADRILNKAYYNNSEEEMLQALKQIQDQACIFMVFGRIYGETFQPSTNLKVPESLKSLFLLVGDNFRIDISSTQIRKESVGKKFMVKNIF